MKNTLIIGAIVLVVIIAALGFFLANNGGRDDLIDFEKQAASDSASPKTEIRSSGFNAEILVTPSVGNVISGVVTVSITKAPAGAKVALFSINKQGTDIKTAGPNLGIDSNGSDGWTKLVDTTRYANGLYDISGFAGVDGNSDPLGVATAQVVIEN